MPEEKKDPQNQAGTPPVKEPSARPPLHRVRTAHEFRAKFHADMAKRPKAPVPKLQAQHDQLSEMLKTRKVSELSSEEKDALLEHLAARLRIIQHEDDPRDPKNRKK